MNKLKNTVAVGATTVMFGFAISRVLGYIKLKSLAYVFGAGYQTDAYVAVFNVIDILYFLIAGGALSAAFIPIFSELLKKEENYEAWYFANNILNILLVVCLAGTLLWFVFAPYFVKLIAPGFDKKTSDLCVILTRFMLPMVFFTVMSSLFSAILNSFGNFSSPTFAFIFYSIPTIIVTLLLGPKFGITVLPIGVIIGAIGLVAIQLPSVVKCGFRYKLTLNISHAKVKQVILLFIPAMLSLLISQLNLVIIPQFFSSYLDDGVVTYLMYASRLIMLPYGIFAVAISVAIFPTLSKVTNDNLQWKNILSKGISSTFYFSIPSSIFLVILNVSVVKLLYFGGEFNEYDVKITANILTYLTIGLVGLSALQVISRGFYSQKNTITPLKVGIVSLILNVVLAYFFFKLKLEYLGPPLATSISLLFNMMALLLLLKPDYKIIIIAFLKCAFAGGILAIFLFVGKILINNFIDTSTIVGAGKELLILGVIGCFGYITTTYLLKMNEVQTILDILKRKIKNSAN